jgi:hypothetical protein
MVADFVHFTRCVVESDNTTFIVITFSSGRIAKWCVVTLSSCRPVSSEARQTARCRAARCRDVALLLGFYINIQIAFDLS